MPSTYAHYRFGAAMYRSMDADIRRTVARYRRLYDVGLHGPDLFLYYNPALSTKTGALSKKFHRQTGQEFFTRVCRGLRLEPSEAGFSYLYGVLCHYCLDSVCHPFVNAKAAEGPAGHTEIETEFDRFLLERDGKLPPHEQDISRHLQLADAECAAAAGFYPPATARDIRRCVKNMAFFIRLLTAPEGAKRAVITRGAPLVSANAASMVMPTAPNPRCAHLDAPLEELYREAEARFPVLLSQLQAHLTYNAPLEAEFEADFG